VIDREARRKLFAELRAESERDAKERKETHPQWPDGPWCSHCPNLTTGPHKMSCYGPRPTELEVFIRLAGLGMTLPTEQEE